MYWNRKPSLVALEAFLKGLVVLVAIGSGPVLLPFGLGTGGGFLCVLPAAVAVAGWKTCSKLTRHQPYFHPGILWSAASLLLGLVLGLLVDWRLVSLALLVLPVRFVCGRAEAWKQRRIRGAHP